MAERGLPRSGGAASSGSPERRRRTGGLRTRRPERSRGDGDSAALAAFRRAAVGEDEEDAAAEDGTVFDLKGEQRHGGTPRRRRRRLSGRPREREEGGGDLCERFCRKVLVIFVIYVFVPRLAFTCSAGSIVGFERGIFAKPSRTRRAVRPIAVRRRGPRHCSLLFICNSKLQCADRCEAEKACVFHIVSNWLTAKTVSTPCCWMDHVIVFVVITTVGRWIPHLINKQM